MRQSEFWMTFGLNDVRSKYRRSALGQIWITLTAAIFILVVGGLYRGIFAADAGNYMAYMAIGYITWLFLSDTVSLGCGALSRSHRFMLQRKWPTSVFVFRLIYRQILVFAHHVFILPPMFFWLGIWPGFLGLAVSLLGLIICAFTAFWVALFFSIFALRFRDLTPIIPPIMRMFFFATPVIWLERNLSGFAELVSLLNPFRYFIHIVRAPLLGQNALLGDYIVCLSICFLMMVLALHNLESTRKKLAYWL